MRSITSSITVIEYLPLLYIRNLYSNYERFPKRISKNILYFSQIWIRGPNCDDYDDYNNHNGYEVLKRGPNLTQRGGLGRGPPDHPSSDNKGMTPRT